MNTTNILLATTSLLILVAFILSFGNFKKGTSGDQADEEYKKMRLELAELKRETQAIEEMQRAALYQTLISAPTAPVVEEATSELTQEQQDEIERLKKQLAEKDAENDRVEKENKMLEKENFHVMEEKTREHQREERKKNRVRMALKMGTVNLVNTEYGFLSFVPDNQMNFQPGDILGIRRHSGILGRVRVTRQEGEQYIADIQPNPYAASGLPEAREGDDLIKLTDDYNKPEGE